MVVALCFTAIVTPVEVAFFETDRYVTHIRDQRLVDHDIHPGHLSHIQRRVPDWCGGGRLLGVQ